MMIMCSFVYSTTSKVLIYFPYMILGLCLHYVQQSLHILTCHCIWQRLYDWTSNPDVSCSYPWLGSLASQARLHPQTGEKTRPSHRARPLPPPCADAGWPLKVAVHDGSQPGNCHVSDARYRRQCSQMERFCVRKEKRENLKCHVSECISHQNFYFSQSEFSMQVGEILKL